MTYNNIELLISNLDGWLRGLAEINGPMYSGCAFSVVLEDQKNIELSFKKYLEQVTEYNRENFNTIDWPIYYLRNWIEITHWVGALEEALADLLLPNPLDQQENLNLMKVNKIKSSVAWHVMDIIRSITNDFSSKSIYKVDYEREKYSRGLFYVIPLNSDFLVLDFGCLLPETEVIELPNIL